MNKKHIILWLTLSLSLFTLVGCATPELTGPKTHYKEKQKKQIPPNEALLVLYRDKKGKAKGSPVVRVDDHVIGALNPGQHLTANTCQGENQLILSQQGKPTEPYSTSFTAKPGDTLYFRIQESADASFYVERVPRSTALNELKKTKHSSFLVNRKSHGCTPEEPQPILIKEVTLSTDALFQFDSANLDGLIGRKTLDRLAEDIQSQNIEIDTIRIIGHTDRLGSEKYNQKLSENRANTVAEYLRSKGLKGNIKTQGMGATSPITQNCQGTKPTPKLIECLQPDRRVNVELWGTKEDSK